MLLALWYSLRGYVKIKIRGFSAERFMNLVIFRDVYLWDIRQDGAVMTMKAPADCLDILYACQEKTGCTLEILSFGGLPAFCRRVSGRKVWTAGMFVFAVGLYLLSSFIWTVRIEGNERLEPEEILSACEEMGLKPAAWKRNIDTEMVMKELLLQFADISWVSVGIDGTNVTIKLAETIEKAERIDRRTPCDIVASHDGVIVAVTAERGTPVVQAGDVVKKGDILISSDILIGLEGEEQRTEQTAAEGAVTARIWQTLAEEQPLQTEEIRYSGVEKENYSIVISEKEVDIIHPDGAGKWEKTVLAERPLQLGDFRVPLLLRKELWKEYEILKKTRTIDETKSILAENLRKKTENLLTPYGKIEESKIYFEEYADSIRGEAEVILLDRIDEKRKTEPIERECENLNEF